MFCAAKLTSPSASFIFGIQTCAWCQPFHNSRREREKVYNVKWSTVIFCTLKFKPNPDTNSVSLHFCFMKTPAQKMEKSTPTTTCGAQSRAGSVCAIWGPPCAKTWSARTSVTVRKLWPRRASAALCAWLQLQLPTQTPQQVRKALIQTSCWGLSMCHLLNTLPVSVLCHSCRWEERGELHGRWGGPPSQRHLETRALPRVRLRQRRRHLRWGAVWTAVKLREGRHTWGRVLPRVWQLCQCQQDDRWDESDCYPTGQPGHWWRLNCTNPLDLGGYMTANEVEV